MRVYNSPLPPPPPPMAFSAVEAEHKLYVTLYSCQDYISYNSKLELPFNN